MKVHIRVCMEPHIDVHMKVSRGIEVYMKDS